MKEHRSKPFEAFIREQIELSRKIKLTPLQKNVRFIAGVDSAFSSRGVVFSAGVIWDLEEEKVVEERWISGKVTVPYVPTFLYLREGPWMVKVVQSFSIKPDVILVDGQGVLHPRKMGIACYVGVMTDSPAVGVAKKRLVGAHGTLPEERGSFVWVEVDGEVRGAFLRTRKGVKGVYVSPGHLIDVKGAVDVVRASLGKYRIPEPLRMAHMLADRVKKERG